MNTSTISNLLQSVGLGDGEGSVSVNRINVFLIILTVLLPKIIFAFQGGGASATFTPDDYKMIVLALGAHQVQKFQENKSTPPTT